MSNIAVTHGPQLEELLERTQAQFDLLKTVKELRDQRSEHLRKAAELEHQLSKFENPLRELVLLESAAAALPIAAPVVRLFGDRTL